MDFKKLVKDYFHFSRRDRTGLIALVFLILVIYFLPIIFPAPRSFPPSFLALDTLASDSGTGSYSPPSYVSTDRFNRHEDPPLPGRLFAFDPNTLSAEGWRALGLPDRSIRTLLNYRSKGGRFRQPSDLQKIWGLPPGFYARVKDSIKAERDETERPNRENLRFDPVRHDPSRIGIVDINLADTAAFIALPGIGAKLAARIVGFRERLGGFVSPDQLAETYGLPDSTFRFIRPWLRGGGEVHRLHINTATADELKNHPYLRWKLAHAIVDYRNQHGPYKSLEELKNLAAMDEETFARVRPYLDL